MSESRLKKRKVEFIESYWTGGEFGSDYQWNDNHGELIRCKDCQYRHTNNCIAEEAGLVNVPDDWYCADGVKKDG